MCQDALQNKHGATFPHHTGVATVTHTNATVPHSSGWLVPSLPYSVAHADVEAYLLGDLNNAAGQIQPVEWSITA